MGNHGSRLKWAPWHAEGCFPPDRPLGIWALHNVVSPLHLRVLPGPLQPVGNSCAAQRSQLFYPWLGGFPLCRRSSHFVLTPTCLSRRVGAFIGLQLTPTKSLLDSSVPRGGV